MTVTRAAARRARRNNNATLESESFSKTATNRTCACLYTGTCDCVADGRASRRRKSLGRCTTTFYGADRTECVTCKAKGQVQVSSVPLAVRSPVAGSMGCVSDLTSARVIKFWAPLNHPSSFSLQRTLALEERARRKASDGPSVRAEAPLHDLSARSRTRRTKTERDSVSTLVAVTRAKKKCLKTRNRQHRRPHRQYHR